MSVDASPVTVRVPLPYDIVRGQAHTLEAPLYRDGAAVTATAATCTLYDDSGQAVTLAASATVPAGVPTQVIGSTELDDYSFGASWRVEWSITHAGGTIPTRHEAALVRSGLSPVISDEDLYRVYRWLDADAGTGVARASRADYQDARDEAWTEIMLRLRGLGRRPYLILSPSALRQVHLHLSLALVFGAYGAGQGPEYLELASMHRQQYDAAFSQLALVYDSDDDGEIDDGGRVGGPPSMWLMSRA